MRTEYSRLTINEEPLFEPTVQCERCWEPYSEARARLGFTLCKDCGEENATQARSHWTVAQLYSKGNYQLITDPTDLTRTNPKRTT